MNLDLFILTAYLAGFALGVTGGSIITYLYIYYFRPTKDIDTITDVDKIRHEIEKKSHH